jgi:hypothetical protein
MVNRVSEINVRGSLLVNEVLLHCLRNKHPLPAFKDSFFKACFLQDIKTNSRTSKEDYSTVKDVFDNEFFDYPRIERRHGDGDGQMITIAARKYGTNLTTSIHYAFLDRQKAFIRTWLRDQQNKLHRQHNLRQTEWQTEVRNMQLFVQQFLSSPDHEQEKKKKEDEIEILEKKMIDEKESFNKTKKVWKDVSLYHVMCAINGWTKKSNRKRKRGNNNVDDLIPKAVQDFIHQERDLLKNPKDFDPEGVSDTDLLLRYLFHILEYYRENKVGHGFPLAPICKIKRHFLTIDTTGLHEMLKAVSKKTTKLPKQLSEILKLSNKKIFENSSTISAMWRETFNIDGLRRRRRFGNQIDTDGISLVTHFNVKVRARTKHKKRRRYKQRKQQQGVSSSTRIISIDPGRNNLVMAFDSATSCTRKLTRKMYYQRAGIYKATRKIANCELPLQGVISKLAKASIRTSSPRLSYEYRQTIIKNYDRLWQHRTERKRSKFALTVCAGKRRTLDKFFVDLKTMGGVSKNDKRSIVIAYGAATMNPTGKGETSVPVKGVLKVCQRHYSTVMVNEHLTTKVHNVCHQRLNPVSRMTERFPIRGLCWCQTCSKYVSRDGNAAQNILRVYRAKMEGIDRPHDLRFGQSQQKMQTLAKVPIPQKTNKLWRELLSF